jgi:hypothetical protein
MKKKQILNLKVAERDLVTLSSIDCKYNIDILSNPYNK